MQQELSLRFSFQIKQNFESIQSDSPPNQLRDALFNSSTSPESFFVLRSNFASSLAALSITNWILGIGDRHCSNLLLNTRNGKLVGIDFGFVFGAATRDQLIPELLPFRLTPNLVGVMSPLETSGLLEKCMVHALRTFRSERKLLMTCMDVFINEPTIDWLLFARQRDSDDIETHQSHKWEPEKRIAIVSKKLRGANPVYTLKQDLNSGAFVT